LGKLAKIEGRVIVKKKNIVASLASTIFLSKKKIYACSNPNSIT
jgi:hypothetical protein